MLHLWDLLFVLYKNLVGIQLEIAMVVSSRAVGIYFSVVNMAIFRLLLTRFNV